jgi:hypothetical protein
MMFAASALLLTIAVADPWQETLMNRIEATITLPRAGHLVDYRRYYVFKDPNHVHAVYMDVRLKLAPELMAQPRQWLDRADQLPRIDDGACSQVTIDYEIVFLSIGCNGR